MQRGLVRDRTGNDGLARGPGGDPQPWNQSDQLLPSTPRPGSRSAAAAYWSRRHLASSVPPRRCAGRVRGVRWDFDGSTTLFEDNGMEQLNRRRHPKVEVRVESLWTRRPLTPAAEGFSGLERVCGRGQRPACGSPRRALSRMWVTCFHHVHRRAAGTRPRPHRRGQVLRAHPPATAMVADKPEIPPRRARDHPAHLDPHAARPALEVADQFSGQGNGLLRSPPLRFPAPYADVHVPGGCRPCRSAQLAYSGRPAGPAVFGPATSAQLVTSRRTKLIPLATSRTEANASDSISARE